MLAIAKYNHGNAEVYCNGRPVGALAIRHTKRKIVDIIPKERRYAPRVA